MPDDKHTSDPFAKSNPTSEDTHLFIGSEDGEAYDGGESEIPPKGIYPARCISVERQQSQSGNPMIVFTYMILSPQRYGGVEVMDWIVLSGKMKFKLAVVLRAFGIEAKGKQSVSLDNLINKEVNIKIKPDEYNGQPTVRVETVMKYESTTTPLPSPPDEDDIPF